MSSLFVVVFAAFLLVRMPASVAVEGLERVGVWPAALQGDAASGLWWRGSLSDVTWRDGAMNLRLGRVDWSLQPPSLLRLAPAFDLDWQMFDSRVTAHVEVSRTRLYLKRVYGQITGDALNRIWDGWPLIFGGRLELSDVELCAHRDVGWCAADGVLFWNAAAAGVPLPLDLGSQQGRLALDADGRRMTLALSSQPGAPLQLSGDVGVDLDFDARAIEVTPALDLEAPADGGIDRALGLALPRTAPGRTRWGDAVQLRW